MDLDHSLMLFLPHLVQLCTSFVLGLVSLESVESFHEDLLDTGIPSNAQELLHRLNELGVKIPGESLARVVGQNSDEHDRIVLYVGFGEVVFGQELSNEVCGLLCG